MHKITQNVRSYRPLCQQDSVAYSASWFCIKGRYRDIKNDIYTNAYIQTRTRKTRTYAHTHSRMYTRLAITVVVINISGYSRVKSAIVTGIILYVTHLTSSWVNSATSQYYSRISNNLPAPSSSRQTLP